MGKIALVLKKVNFRLVVPCVLCYLVIGFLVYATVRYPELQWVLGLAILATALGATTAIILLQKGEK